MPAHPSAATRSTRIRAAFALLSVLGFGTVATLASFTDEGSQVTTFSAGTVDMKFNSTGDDNPTALTSLTMDKVRPGTAKTAPLTVRNSGSLGFGYTMTTTATGDLAPALRLSVVKVADAASCGTSTDFDAAVSTDTIIASGTSLNAAPVTKSRLLAPTGSEVLCFRVELPEVATNEFQGDTASATFTFNAQS